MAFVWMPWRNTAKGKMKSLVFKCNPSWSEVATWYKDKQARAKHWRDWTCSSANLSRHSCLQSVMPKPKRVLPITEFLPLRECAFFCNQNSNLKGKNYFHSLGIQPQMKKWFPLFLPLHTQFHSVQGAQSVHVTLACQAWHQSADSYHCNEWINKAKFNLFFLNIHK